MKISNVAVLATAVLFGAVMLGCEKKEGPLERAGKSVDKAVEKAGDKVERAGDKIQDAAKGK